MSRRSRSGLCRERRLGRRSRWRRGLFHRRDKRGAKRQRRRRWHVRRRARALLCLRSEQIGNRHLRRRCSCGLVTPWFRRSLGERRSRLTEGRCRRSGLRSRAKRTPTGAAPQRKRRCPRCAPACSRRCLVGHPKGRATRIRAKGKRRSRCGCRCLLRGRLLRKRKRTSPACTRLSPRRCCRAKSLRCRAKGTQRRTLRL